MADAKEKLSVQAKFDQFIDYVNMGLEKKGRQLIFVDGLWYEYREGCWTSWNTRDVTSFNTFLYKLASSHEFSFSTQKHAIWTTLEAALGSEDPIEFDAVPMIVCNTKTYFVADDKAKKHSPLHYATRRVNVDVDPGAECPLWLDMLDRIFEDYSKDTRREIIKFLQEWMGIAIVGGSCVQNSRDMRKGLFLYGEKRTGKSSISDVLIELYGGLSRIATPSLSSLSSQFGLEPLLGKTAIITSEAADAKTVADSNILKNLITGDPIQVNQKNKTSIPFRWHGPVLFTTNNLPKIEDETDALYDRTVIVEFTRQFTPDDLEETLDGHPNVITYLKAKKQMPGILNWCLTGYDDAVSRGRLLLPSSAQSLSERFRRQNDRVFDFLRSCCEFDGKRAVGSEALAVACVEFAMSRHDVRISVAAAARALARQARSTIPGVLLHQGYHDKTQFRAYHKLRLNDVGLSMLEMAKTKPYPNIKQTMSRVNYSYG